MSFRHELERLEQYPYEELWKKTGESDVRRALSKERLDEADFLALLSPAAEPFLEQMAQRAMILTRAHFGYAMQLFTPMYVADFCVNKCTYCSFSADYDFARRKLTMEQIRREAAAIAATGLKHVLLLTGESRKDTPMSYLVDCITTLREFFPSVSVEIFPLRTEEYRELVQAGADGLTLYQEVYHRESYSQLHVKGPKRVFLNRLDAPERGCMAGFRNVNIGALLGMYEWRREAFHTGMHASYLQNKYPDCEISLSAPRFRPYLGSHDPASDVSDRNLVQTLLAYRLFLPRSGITLSTRERPELRDNLVHLGITKMSAGVSTEVGGHTAGGGTPQFEISDDRSVDEVCSMLYKSGMQPVFKDWDCLAEAIPAVR